MLSTAFVAPASLGFGIGLLVFWAGSTGATGRWVRRLRERLGLARPTPPHFAHQVDTLTWARNRKNAEAVHYDMKPLLYDDRSGLVAMMVLYPAGQINPKHRHPAGHGAYVLRGTMVTHRGTFGPGNFVWFPAGEIMWHGATPDADLLVVYVTTGDCRTDYLD